MLKRDCSSFQLRFQVEFVLYAITAYHNRFDFVIDVARRSELTGQEDPLFLYPVISCWTSNSAYQEGR